MFAGIRRNYLALFISFAVGSVLTERSAVGQSTYIWNGATTGAAAWSTPGNWTANSSYPGSTSGTFDTATFGSNLNPTGTVTITDPANLYLNAINFNQTTTTAGYTLTGGTINLGGTTPTITVLTSGVTETINSVLAGSSGLTTAGSGTITLGGTNLYTGGTFINGGTLAITNLSALSSGAVNFNGGTLSIGYFATPTISNALSVALGTTGTLNLTGSGSANNTVIFTSGTITVNGSLTLTRNTGGTGTTEFKSAFTGSGTLVIGNTQAGTAIQAVSGDQGRAYFLSASNFTNFTGSITVLSGGNFAFPNGLSGNGGLLAANANTVTINAGGYMSIIALASPGQTTPIGGLNGAGSITTNTATGDFANLSLGNGDASGNFSGVIAQTLLLGTGTVNLIKVGAGTQVLSGANVYTGATAIQNGILQLGTSGGTSVGSIATTSAVTLGSSTGNTSGVFQLGDVNNPVSQNIPSLVVSGTGTSNAVVGGNAGISTLSINVTATDVYAGNLGGTGTNYNNLALTKTGAATLTLSGTNTYLGITQIKIGTLQLGSATALPSGTSIILGTATTGASTLDLNGWNATVGGLTVGDSALNTNIIGNSSTTSNSTLTFVNGTSTFAGIIQDAISPGTMQTNLQVSSGNLTLTGANTFTGTTTVNGGTLNAAAAGALGSTNAVTVSGGILNVSASGALSSANTVLVSSGALNVTASNSLPSTSTVTVNGGTLNLGTSNFLPSATTTTVNSTGTLLLQGGTTQYGAVAIASGGSLGVTNLTTPTSTAALSANSTFGAGAANQTILNLGAASDWVPAGPALLSIGGTLTINGTTTLNISTPATLNVGSIYTLISYSGPMGGTGAFALGTLPNPRAIASLINTGSSIELSVTGTDSPKWTGAVNNVWDINTTANWQLISRGTSTTYLQGDAVTFDNSAAGPTNVSLSAAVTPSSVTFNNSSKAYSVSGAGSIGGATTPLTVMGGGAVTLATNNTYGGATTLSSGTLNINSGGTSSTNSAIGTGTLIIGTATTTATIDNTSGAAIVLATNNAQTWSGNFTFTGTNPLNFGTGAVTLGTNVTLTANSLSNPLTVGGSIGDNMQGFSLTLPGPGIVSLSGASGTYSGGTILSGGQLNINGNGAIGTGPLTIGNGLTIDNTSGTPVALTTSNPVNLPANFTFGGSNPLNLGNGPATMSANLVVTTNGTAALTIGGALGDNSNGYNLTKAGSGTLILNGTNTFGGNVTINQGVLSITNSFALSNGSVNIAAGTFNVGYLGTSAPTISNAINVAMGQTGALDVTGSGLADNTITLTDSAGITVNGTLTVTRNSGNTGDTYFNAPFSGSGTLVIGNTQAGTIPQAVAGSLGRAWFLDPNNFGNFFGSFHVLSGGNFAFPALFTGQVGIVNGNNVTIDAGGYMSLVGTVPSASNPMATTIGGLFGAGTVTTNTAGAAYTAYLSVGNNNTNGNFSGVLAQNQLLGTALFALIKTGSGTQILSGVSSYTGGTTINGGTLSFAYGALGTGLITFGGNSTLQWYGANSQDISSLLTINDGVIGTIDTNGNNVTFASAIVIGAGQSGTGGLTKAGLGTLTLAGANAFTGPTTIIAGVVNYTNATAFGTNSAITIQAGATAQIAGGISGGSQPLGISGAGAAGTTGALENVSGVNSYRGPLTLGTNSTISSDAGTLNLTSAGGISGTGNLTLTGPGGGSIAGSISTANGGLTKSGSGAWTLNASNSYTGPTVITGGTLQLAGGTTQASPFTVGNGTALSIVNPISTSSVALLSNLTFGAVSTDLTTLNLNAATDWSPSTPALLSVGGTLSALGGAHSTTINVASGATLGIGQYDLIAYSGPIGGTGFSAFVLGSVSGPRTIASLISTGSMIQLNVTAVDSPKWTGAINGVWDINTTQNWQLITHGTPTTYLQGDSVLFDDTASGTTSISLAVAVTPTNVQFSNNAKAYSISGGGAINGATAVTISGGGTVTLATNNGYSGGTNLTAGQLNINAGGAGPSNSALGTGTLTIGTATTIDNTSGSSVVLATNNAQTWNGNFTFIGSNPLNLGTGAVTLGRSVTLTTNSAINTLAVGGPITDNSNGYSLTFAGVGIVTLSGANAYSGGTILAGGQLNINGNGAIGTGPLTIGNGVTIDNTSGAAVALTTGISLNLPASFTFGGSNPLNLGNGAATMSANLVVTTNGTAALTIGGALGDNGNAYNLTKAGAGTLILNGTNTFGGSTYINQGILSITNAGALSGGSVNLAGGTLNIAYLGTATPTISNSINVAMGQTGTLDMTGSGVANNTITLDDSAGITVNGTLTVTRNSGNAGSTVFNMPFSGNGTLVIGNTQAGAPPQPVSGLQGRAEFTDPNNFTNFTGSIHVLSGGNFAFPNGFPVASPAFGLTTQTVTIDAGGYMSILAPNSVGGLFTTTIGALNGAGTVTTNNVATNSVAQLSVGNGGGSGNFSGVLSQSTLLGTAIFALVKTGAGTQILSGVSAYTGGTTINGGVLQLGIAGAIGSNTGALTVNTGGNLDLNGTSQTIGSLNGSGGKIFNSAATTISTLTVGGSGGAYAGTIADNTGTGGTVALIMAGTGTLALTGVNSYSGGTTISSGTLNINSDSALGAATGVVNLTSGALQFAAGGGITLPTTRSIVLGGGAFDTNFANDTINGVISGSDPVNSNLVKNGAGALALTNINTYAGSTIVNAGGLVVGSTASLDSGPLMINNTNPAPSSTDVYLYNTAGQTVGNLSSNLTGDASGNTVGIFLGAGVTLTVNQTAPGTFQGTIFGGGNLVLGSSSTSTLTLTGNSTYAGSTTINGGTLQLGVANALPPTTSLTLGSGGTLNLNSNNQTIAALNNSAGNISTGTGTGGILTVGNTAGGTVTYSGVISGTGGLTWGIVNTNVPNPTPSTLLLTNTSTNTGPMTINTGTLSIGTAYALSGGVAPVLPYNASNSYPGPFTLGPTATLLTNGFNLTVGSLGGGGPIGGNINLGNNSSSTLYIVQSSSTGYAGVIFGTGNVYIVNGVNLAVYGNWTLTGGVTHDVTTLGANHNDSPQSYWPFATSGPLVATQGIEFAGFTDQVSTIYGGSASDNNGKGTFVDASGDGGKLVLSYYAATVANGGPANGSGGTQNFSGFFANDVGLIFDAGYFGNAQQLTLSGPNNTTGPLTIGFTNQTTPQNGAAAGAQSGVMNQIIISATSTFGAVTVGNIAVSNLVNNLTVLAGTGNLTAASVTIGDAFPGSTGNNSVTVGGTLTAPNINIGNTNIYGVNNVLTILSTGTVKASGAITIGNDFATGSGTLNVNGALGTTSTPVTSLSVQAGGVLTGYGTINTATNPISVTNGTIRGGFDDGVNQLGTLSIASSSGTTAKVVLAIQGSGSSGLGQTGALMTEVLATSSTAATNSKINITGANNALNLNTTSGGGSGQINIVLYDPTASLTPGGPGGATYTFVLATVATAGRIQVGGANQPAGTLLDTGTTLGAGSGTMTNADLYIQGASTTYMSTVTTWSLFIDSTGKQLVLSVTSTPEPEHILLMCVGVLLAGFAIRHRRQRMRSAASVA